MFNLLSSAFGIGSKIAGLGAPKQAERVNAAEDAFNARVADIQARRIRRDNRYQIGAQALQISASGGMRGSLMFAAAADARKARERVTDVYLNKQAREAANAADVPQRDVAGTVGSAFKFGQGLFNFLGG